MPSQQQRRTDDKKLSETDSKNWGTARHTRFSFCFIGWLSPMQAGVALYKRSKRQRLCHERLVRRQMGDDVRFRIVDVHRSLGTDRNPIHHQRRREARVSEGGPE